MKFVVGTSNGLMLVDNWKISQLHAGHFYGITFDENCLYAFMRKKKQCLMCIFDKSLKFLGAREFPGEGIHQTYFDPITKKIYVTYTVANCLTVIDPYSNKHSFARWHKNDKDHNHINSIFRFKNHLYVYEHDLKGKNEEKGNGGVRRLSPDFKSEQEWRIGDQGHNVFIRDDSGIINVYVLDSFNKRYIRRPLNDSYQAPCTTLIRTSEYEQFACRGLAISNTHTFIGLTKLQPRSKRGTIHPGYIVCYDNQYKKVRDIEISMGQIYEVRLLDELDQAHNNIIWRKEN
jgi:hypothetical protein